MLRPLAAVGDVREDLFHMRYILWSMVAALSMWSLARRFCEKPWWAVLLFIAVPAFVINGTSLGSRFAIPRHVDAYRRTVRESRG